MEPKLLKKEQFDEFDTFLFDADGVLWAGETPIPGANDLVSELIEKKKQVFIITNNATKSRKEYAKKVQRDGFLTIAENNIVSSGTVLAEYLISNGFRGKKVYLIGVESLKNFLEETVGVECRGVGPDEFATYTDGDFMPSIEIEEGFSAVIVSFDDRISYPKIMKAVNILKDENVAFLITNEDATLPGPVKGFVVPGEGCMSAAVRTATHRIPTVIGKPASPMADFLKKTHGVVPEKTIMFGDRLDTDVKFANTAGFTSCLMLTEYGCHSLETVNKAIVDNRKDLVPKYTYSYPSVKK